MQAEDIAPAADDLDSIFVAEMSRLGPFEPRPALAVAVSGGRDSMALTLLAAHWVAARGGSLTGLIVDHGLRPDSAAEAHQTARWLAARGISAHVLRWQGAKPASRLQASARDARYALLTSWCRRRGVLHLLTAHHRGDQAETLAMRRHRSRPGDPPQTGMAAARPAGGVRLLRPLLSMPRARLEALLHAHGQSWLDDPSNDDPRFERVRIRRNLTSKMADSSLCAEAIEAVRTRARAECALATVAARCLSMHPAGFAAIDRANWLAAAPDVATELLRQTLRCIAGAKYPPAQIKVTALAAALRQVAGGMARTLGGCQIVAQDNVILVVREPGRLPPPIAIGRARTLVWDRFHLVLRGAGTAAGLTIGALKPAGLRKLGQDLAPDIPREAALSLPALWRGDIPLAVVRLRRPYATKTGKIRLFGQFSPPEPLLMAGLRVV